MNDLFDLYFLINQFSLSEAIEWCTQKFQAYPPVVVLKSLLYFTDAEMNANPKMLKDVSWEEVKSFISSETQKLTW